MALAAKAFTLAFVLTATDKMSQVIDRAVSKSLGSLSSFERNAGKIGGALMKGGMQMLNAGAAAAGGLVSMSKAAADYAGDMKDMARATGVGFEEIQELAYAAKMSGIEADKLKVAFVKLDKAMTEAASGNKTYLQTFSDLGIQLRDSEGNLRKPNEIFEEVAELFSKTEDSAAKTALAYELFGKSGADLIPMLNDGKAGMEEWFRMAREAGLVMGDEMGTAAETAGDQMDGLMNKLRGTSLQLGTRLIPTVTAFVEKLDATLSRVLEWIDRNPKLVESIGQIALQGAKWLVILGGGSVALGGLSVAIGKVGTAFRVVQGVFKAGSLAKGIASMLTPMGWVKAAVMVIVALAYLVIRNWEAISGFFVRLWGKVKEIFSAAWAWIKNLFLNYTPQGLIIQHWDTIVAFFAGLWAKVKTAFSTAWAWIKNLLLNYTPQGLIIRHWDTIVAFFAGLWSRVVAGISDSWNRIRDWFANLQPVEWIRGAWESVGNFFATLGTRFFEWGRNLLESLWRGITSVVSRVVEGVRKVGRKIADGFRSFFGINSPSRLFAEYGLNITQGLVVGLDRGGNAVEAATGGVAARTMAGMEEGMTYGGATFNALTGGSVTVHYAPQITINGASSEQTRDEFSALLRKHAAEILDIIRRDAANTARLSFTA